MSDSRDDVVVRFPGGAPPAPTPGAEPEPIDDGRVDDGIAQWPAPVDAHIEIFEPLVRAFIRFIVLPPGAPEVLALWVILSWCLHRPECGLNVAPRLVITAPTRRAGKSEVLKLLNRLVRKPRYAYRLTPAWFYRQMGGKAVVLIDEAQDNIPTRDTGRSPILAMLKGGHTPEGEVVNADAEISAFGLVALAGKGEFAPPQLADRSLPIRVKRRLPTETIERFDPAEHEPAFADLKAKIVRFVADRKDDIRRCRPEFETEIFDDRAADNARVLLQIADVIGCGDTARDAIESLLRHRDIRDPGEVLLADISELFGDAELCRDLVHRGHVFSDALCKALRTRFPHRDAYVGLGQPKLAAMLRPFGLETKSAKRGRHVLRAYDRDAFDDPILRYVGALPATALPFPDVPEDAAYVRAFRVMPNRGEKRRDARLSEAIRQAFEEDIVAGSYDFWFAPDRVAFISPWFWIVQNEAGVPVLWHLQHDEIRKRAIIRPGLSTDNTKRCIIISGRDSWSLTDSDYERVRAIVNRAKALLGV